MSLNSTCPSPHTRVLMKEDGLVAYLKNFRRWHTLLTVPYGINWLVMPRLWKMWRDQHYFIGQICDHDSKLSSFLELALPHGLFNIKADPPFALKIGFIGNTVLILLLYLSHILLKRKCSTKLRSFIMSSFLSLELAWMISVLTLTVLNGVIEWKMPSMPFGITWSTLISALGFSQLQLATVNKCSILPWENAKSSNLVRLLNSGLLPYADDFTTLKGHAALVTLLSGRVITGGFLGYVWEVGRSLVSVFSNTGPKTIILLVLLSLVTLICDCLVAINRILSLLTFLSKSQNIKLPWRKSDGKSTSMMWLIFTWPITSLMFSFSLVTLFLIHYPTCTMDDVIIDGGKPAPVLTAPPHLLFTKAFRQDGYGSSQPNGFLIHADIYLPIKMLENWILNDLKAEFTVFTATRYNRSTQVLWPFSVAEIWGQKSGTGRAAILSWPLTRSLIRNNVPSIIVDARGSGGSGGIRYVDLDDAEIAEMNAVARWSTEAFWTEPFLAAGGISYDGMTAIKMSTQDDSPINVTIGLYAPLAPVTDLLQLDGIPCQSFLTDYDGVTTSFELKGTPATHFFKSALKGLLPLHTALGFTNVFGRALPAAGFSLDLKNRHLSWSMKEQAERKMFITDTIRLSDGRTSPIINAGLTPHDYDRIQDKGLGGYYVFGECDSSAFRVGERLEQRYRDENLLKETDAGAPIKMIYGPWAHGGRRGCQSGGRRWGSWPCSEELIYDDCLNFIKGVKKGSAKRGLTIQKWESDGTDGKWIDPETLKESVQLANFGINSAGTYMDPIGALKLSDTEDRETTLRKINAAGWIDKDTVWIRDRRRFNMSKMFRGEYVAKPRPLPACNVGGPINTLVCTVKALFKIPISLQNDLRIHWEKRDFYGLAYDLSDISTYSLDVLRRIWNTWSDSRSGTLKRASITKGRLDNLGVEYLQGDLPEWTTGRYSRWVIVQHLLRLPVEYSHTNPYEPTALPSIVIESLPLSEDLTVHGSPYITLRMLFTQDMLEPHSCEVPPRATLAQPTCLLHGKKVAEENFDAMVSAVLHVRDSDGSLHYVTEGRLLLSMKGRHDRDWLLNADSVTKLAKNQASVYEPYDRPFETMSHRFVSQLLKGESNVEEIGDGDIEGGVIDARILMESIIRVFPKYSRLVLTIFGPDGDNFQWDSVSKRYQQHGEGKHNAFDKVSRITSLKLLTKVNDTPTIPLILTLPKSTDATEKT